MIEPPPPSFIFGRQYLVHSMVVVEVGLQHLVPVGQGHGLGRARRADADIVVQDVETAISLGGELGHRLGGIGLGDVTREHRGLAAFVLDLLGKLVGALGAAIDQHHPGALAREHQRRRHAVADALAARRRARHHRDLVLETSGHFSPPRSDAISSANLSREPRAMASNSTSFEGGCTCRHVR